jgi:hypothetical protein
MNERAFQVGVNFVDQSGAVVSQELLDVVRQK